MKQLSVILTLLAVLVAGCTGGKGTGDFTEIKFGLTGGIAGFNKWIAIAPDGAYQIVDREKEAGRGKLSDADLTALKQAVGQIQWAQLQEKYADPKVADSLLETVTITLGEKTYTTSVGTGGTPPAELSNLTGWLRQLLTKPAN